MHGPAVLDARHGDVSLVAGYREPMGKRLPLLGGTRPDFDVQGRGPSATPRIPEPSHGEEETARASPLHPSVPAYGRRILSRFALWWRSASHGERPVR